MDFSYREAIDPADSALGKVLFEESLCESGAGDFNGIPSILYEVDAQGNVTAQIMLMEISGNKYYMRNAPNYPERFVVEDGCLSLDIDVPTTDPPPDIDIDLPEPDTTEYPTPPCGWGRRTIDRSGEVSFLRAPSGEYICVESDISSYEHNCWSENGSWHDEMVSSRSYTALGALDNVSVADWAQACGAQQQAVNITDGDQVSSTSMMSTVYRTSPSPEELGYEPWPYSIGSPYGN